MSRPVEVVAAVIIADGKVFACRRAPRLAAELKWEFPGGKVDPGENPRDALVRELKEELNLAVELSELIHRATTPVGAIGIDLSCYRAALVGGAPKNSTDHNQLGWFFAHELLELDWAAPDIPAVHEVIRRAGELIGPALPIQE